MRVLVTWGSKLGGTAGIGALIAEALTARGVEVVATEATAAPPPDGFDAVILGGAIYAGRWHRAARRYADRHLKALARVPVWLFSSGPLGDEAARTSPPPPRAVTSLIDRIGALGHITFGGRLEPTVTGFPAAAMAKKLAGDWRDPAQIHAWANEIADGLPDARPRPVVVSHGRSPLRLVEYGVVGWVLPATALVIAAPIAPWIVAITLHGVLMVASFGVLAARYQRLPGARAPIWVALTWTLLTGALELILVAPRIRSYVEMASSASTLWLPLSLALFVAWASGSAVSMMPPRPTPRGAS